MIHTSTHLVLISQLAGDHQNNTKYNTKYNTNTYYTKYRREICVCIIQPCDFEWKREIGGNDSHNAAIVLKSELDKDKFTAFCDEWGFLLNVCDEAETDDEAE